MDFVKKNLGLLICGVVCLVLAVVLTMAILNTKGKMAKHAKNVAEQKAFFDSVSQKGYKLTAPAGAELENLVQARHNYEEAEKFYRANREYLSKTFAIPYEIPSTSPDALKQLGETVSNMTEFVLKNNINFQGLAKDFSNIIANGNISESEFPPVFRLLTVYENIVHLLADAGIKEVRQLEFPMKFAVQEEDFYTITPIWFSVDCEADLVQSFLNKITDNKKMLFYIKNISFAGPETFSDVVAELQSNRSEQSPQMAQGMDFSGEPGAGRPRNTPRRTQPLRNPQNSRREAGDEMMNPRGNSENMSESQKSRLVTPEPRRQDYLAFGQKTVTLEVRLDLYEFKKLEE